VWVDVPSALALQLAGMNANPAFRDLQVAFTLPTAAPATLELLDISGRSVESIQVGSLGAGGHTVQLGTQAHLRSGVYLIRLTQGSHSISTKTAFIR